jgi:DNA polymerase I-like protein with 3'-5' exonuclease and polymerase domains
MVQLKDGKPQMVTQLDMMGEAIRAAPRASTPAAARSTFYQPLEFPEYRPPEYRSIKGLDRIGLDIEGHDPDLKTLGPGAHRENGLVAGVALAYAPGDASYYPVAHEFEDVNLDPDAFWGQLREDAAVFDGEMVGANLQYDLDWLRTRHGIFFPKARFRDVQVAEPLLDENRMTYKLDALAKDYLNVTKTNEELIHLYGPSYIEQMHRVHPAHCAPYAQDDTLLAWRIMDKQLPRLEDENLVDLFHLEAALTPLLLEMRVRGVRVNVDRAAEAHAKLLEEQEAIQKRISEMSQAHVDIWSADSIAIAFDNLGLEYERTATGRPSFRKDWLNACNAEVAKLIVQARANDKIAGTFIKSYILESHVNGRLHCMFNQLKSDENGTVSGRFSSSSPNLQNIPARDPVLGPLMRSMFIPEEGMLWGSLDWSQIEYRLLVHYAAITKGIDASEAVRRYREDKTTDFHSMASEITGVPRKQAKNINFGVVYGMGVRKLAVDLGVTIEEAQAIMGQFQENAPFMREMLDRCSARASGKGSIKTILGRKRRFNAFEVRHVVKGQEITEYVDEGELDAFCSGKSLRGRPRRAFTHKALNALLQGSAADLMKKAMVDMWNAGIFNVLVPHLTVHDEFNSSVPDTKEGREAFEEMRHIMETAIKLEIPVLADGALGSNWDEAK